MYEGYHFIGMHWGWWFIWSMLMFWIFFIPYRIPGQRTKTQTPEDILKLRFASGEISNEELMKFLLYC